MALKEDLEVEICRLEFLITPHKLQHNPKLNAVIKEAEGHSKLLKDSLNLIKKSGQNPNVGLLNQDEYARFRLECSRAFTIPLIGRD